MAETTYRSTFRVTGMTCAHCVASVSEEVSEVADVTDVSVDLSSGTLTVTSGRPVSEGDVRAAVTEAGYEMP